MSNSLSSEIGYGQVVESHAHFGSEQRCFFKRKLANLNHFKTRIIQKNHIIVSDLSQNFNTGATRFLSTSCDSTSSFHKLIARKSSMESLVYGIDTVIIELVKGH